MPRSRALSSASPRSPIASLTALVVALMITLGLTVALASCGSEGGAAASGSAAEVRGAIAVFAAASLTAAYSEIGEAFTAAHPGTEVTFNFAASSDLVRQIVEGAPADVFASADAANMAKLTDAGSAAGEPEVFATNSLQIIVQPGNPDGIAGLADLARPGLIYLTCAPEVPIGRYAAQVLEAAQVSVSPASFEENVKGIVTKVTLGEADAGIVYRTDVIAAGGAAGGVDIPADVNVVASYPLAITTDSPNAAGARAFVDFVLDAEGQDILASHGFGPP